MKTRNTNKPKKVTLKRIFRLATQGGLRHVRGGITAVELASIRCRRGYTALHYAARFGHLHEIRGGATFETLAKVKSGCAWILEYDSVTKQGTTQIFSGVSALSIAITFGHLDQVRGTVTLAKLRAAKDENSRSAMSVLNELISEGEDPAALGNNIIACPEIVCLLSPINPIHVRAVRYAMNRNPKLESVLKPEMIAALI